MTKIDVMIDIETWGTDPGCDLRSIGACVFDPVAGWIPDIAADLAMINDRPVESRFYIACDNPIVKHPAYDSDCSTVIRKYPLTRDPRTVQWWSEQSDEAQAAFADPVDLREGLERFTIWLNSIATPDSVPPSNGHGNIRLWAHGSHFDPPILAAAYRAVGLPVPWHYRAPRDTRTIFDAAGIDDHSAWLNAHPGPLAILHHALDDAICQARAVCAAYDRMYRICHADDRWTPPE
jgi:hypothetical protein